MKKANKQEMELRAGFAADLLSKSHSVDLLASWVNEEYSLSRRQVLSLRQGNWHDFQDFDEIYA